MEPDVYAQPGLQPEPIESDDSSDDLEYDNDFDYTSAFAADDVQPSNMDTHLPENNKGFMLLQKMGWSKGTGLGREGTGRIDPIPIIYKDDSLGIGKSEQYEARHIEVTSKRKALDSERLLEETDEQRAERESKVLKEASIKSELKQTTSAFYCSLCDKQYSKISEYETHLSSYDHNHRKRFKEMRTASKSGALPGLRKKSNKEDKERAREERELKRMQEALQSKIGGGPPPPPPIVETTSVETPAPEVVMEEAGKEEPQNDDKGGWGVLSDAPAGGGWSSVAADPVGGFKPVQEGTPVKVKTPPAPAGPKLSFGFGMAKKGSPAKFSMNIKKK
ncbi:hypothetical protein HK097_008447 [Rhizophlyctis rosea]|uniref:G-patch domain-containing protein n=1 Tax=Rhizophlyctis rosea TaxID=64517 RepID=A0AAD5SKF7_9FUNG|nr:hypothetical protein HK097_008447 [Rhizophlyctis rosea]